MNRDEIRGRLELGTGQTRASWGKLNDCGRKQFAGKRTELHSRLQKRYGHVKETVEKQVDALLKDLP